MVTKKAARLERRELVIAVHDLAGFARACEGVEELALARFLDDYYAACADLVRGGGGRIVKFLGDACLAVFPPERAVGALDAVVALRAGVAPLALRHRLPVSAGKASLHVATVAAGELGPAGD